MIVRILLTAVAVVCAWIFWGAVEPYANTPDTVRQGGALVFICVVLLVIGSFVRSLWRPKGKRSGL